MFPNQGLGLGGGTFSLFPILFFIVFFLILGTIIIRLITGIKRWNNNNHQPILTVASKISSKRTEVRHHNHNNPNNTLHNSSTTYYYVTFEVDSGDRLELQVHGQDYGLLSEGDYGQLTFQGTRFKGFERTTVDNIK